MAGRAFCGQGADFRRATRAQVACQAGAGVACAEGRVWGDSAGGEAHHEEGRGRGGLMVGDGRSGDGQHEFAEVLLVQDDVVRGGVVVVGAAYELGADCDLRGKADDGRGDLVAHEVADGRVDVARVGGVQRAEDEEDFTGAVGGRVEEGCTGHFESVFEGRVAFGLLLAHARHRGNVVGGVAGHVADPEGYAIAHADDAELRDGVLLEELVDEGCGVDEGEEKAGGS